MSMIEVLTPIKPVGKENMVQGKESMSSPDVSLFSMLLNNLTGNLITQQTAATEQESGEQPQEMLLSQGQSIPNSENSVLKDSLPKDGIQQKIVVENAQMTENLLGLQGYLQIPQYEFPAGKEANSGLKDQQSQKNNLPEVLMGNDLQFSKMQLIADQQANLNKQSPIIAQGWAGMLSGRSQMQQNVESFQEIRLEGMTNLISGETASLDSKELDQYRKTLDYLQALSGNMKIGAKKVDMESPVEKTTSHSSQILGKQDMPIPTNIKGNMDGMLDNQSGMKQNEEPNVIQAMGTQGSEISGSESIADTKIKAPIEPGRAWEQVLDILKKQEFRDKEVKELSIRLQPAELGKVNISLRMENGQVHLMMNASEQATGALLQNQLHELKNGLSQMGVSCGHFGMSNGQSGESGSGRDFSQDNHRGGYYLQEEENGSLTSIRSYFSANGSGGKINISA